MSPFFRPATLALLATGLLLMQTAQATERSTYRWTDEKGRVHYSDMRNEKAKPVQIKPGSGVSEAPKESASAQAERQRDCQRKKDQVATYNSSSQISETDSLGNTRNYSAAERQQLIDRAQQMADIACNGTAAAATGSGSDAITR